MAELYTIERQTLTDIADALRGKYGETKIITVVEDIEIPEVSIAKSSNANGHGDYNVATIDKERFLIYIPTASKIEVDLSLDRLSGNQHLIVAKGNRMNDASITIDSTASMFVDSLSHKILTFESDSVTFELNGGGKNNATGYYAECTGYDANGNKISGIIQMSHEEEVPNAYTSAEMAQAIDDLPDAPPPEAYSITGNCQYKFSYGGWDWFVKLYGDKITTKDLTNAGYMFCYSKVESIPFELNFYPQQLYISIMDMFNHCEYLTEVPKFNTCTIGGLSYMFSNCYRLRDFPEDFGDWFDWSYCQAQTSGYNAPCGNTFNSCYSLRNVPTSMFAQVNPVSAYSYSYWSYGFYNCYTLDELVDLPIPYTVSWSNNAFNNSFGSNHRLKKLTFALQEDGTPYVMKWKSQTIDLSSYVGYTTYTASNTERICGYNSGITEDKRVYDDATYQTLKNDPDWWTTEIAYSRYNHDSAVETINSLPDTSAYLASYGGTNTIKFKGDAGSATDGGAINTLTEEEIAVATAKGWTVTLV